MEVLEQIYQGRYRPNEQLRTISDEYQRTEEEHKQCYEALIQILSSNQKELLDQLLSFCSEMGAMDVETAFLKGFKDGAQLMAEILIDS